MQRRAWLRYGLVTLAVACTATGAMLAGCGDDDTTTTTTDAGTDGTTPTDSGTQDTGPADTGTDSATPKHAKLIIVHASPDAPPVRVCFGLSQGGSPFAVPPVLPLPDSAKPGQPYAGLFPGTGGPLPDLLDLSSYALRPYVMVAAGLANDAKGVDAGADAGDAGTPRTCQDLLAAPDAGGLTPGADYFQLPDIPAGTFTHDATFLAAATGCVPAAVDPSGSTAKCGSDYVAGTGNLGIKLFKLDRTTGTGLGAQFAHLSSQTQGAFPNGVYPALISGDGGAAPLVATPVAYGELAPATAHQVPGVDGTWIFGVASSPGSPIFGAPLPVIQLMTIGSTSPSDYFKAGQNYTFVAVGDPAQSLDGGAGNPPNLHAAHILGFNNDPVLPAP